MAKAGQKAGTQRATLPPFVRLRLLPTQPTLAENLGHILEGRTGLVPRVICSLQESMFFSSRRPQPEQSGLYSVENSPLQIEICCARPHVPAGSGVEDEVTLKQHFPVTEAIANCVSGQHRNAVRHGAVGAPATPERDVYVSQTLSR